MNSRVPLHRQSLLELRSALHARELSARELMDEVQAYHARTHPKLNAIVATRPPDTLCSEAEAAQERISRGDARPLEGLPIGIKDLENAAGLPTTHGSQLFAKQVAGVDDLNVARLRAAGGIVFGKTNTPEFGMTAITRNLLFGTTRSPWQLSCTPGGSSGGSAAALAAGVLPVATATDGGGSIRIPASWSGLFGLKPTYGRIPRGPLGHWDTTWRTVSGPLTRTVEDAAFLLDLQVGPSAYDPSALPHPGYQYLERLRTEPAPTGLRIGYQLEPSSIPVQSDVATAVEATLRTLEHAGHRLVSVTESLPTMGEDWLLTDAWELAGTLGPVLAGREGEIARWILHWIEASREVTPTRWAEAQKNRAQLRDQLAEVFERVDLLVTPTTPYTAPPAGGPFPSSVEGRSIDANAAGYFTIPFNLSLQPAASVPVGYCARGLPIGMQIAGPHYSEDRILQVCYALERKRPWHPHWPVVP